MNKYAIPWPVVFDASVCAKILSLAGLIICIASFIYAPAFASVSCSRPVGSIVSIEGNVIIQRSESARWLPATVDSLLCRNDTVRVEADSRAAVSLVNKAVLRLKQNTTIKLTEIAVEEEKKSFLQVIKGIIQSFSRRPHKFAVNTPYLNGSIEGTEFRVEVSDDAAKFTVMEGTVLTSNEYGRVRLNSGESSLSEAGKAPVHSLEVNPRKAVQWAMYFPPILSAYGGVSKPDYITQAASLVSSGKPEQALAMFNDVAETEKKAEYYTYRASLNLSVGQIKEAEQDITSALAISPQYSDALGLMSTIAITKNNPEDAEKYARLAVSAEPQSASALIALSYVQQATFDLPGTLSTLQTAANAEPGNALVWARLAELHAAFKDYDKAFEAAEKAVQIAPDLSLSYSVMGFAQLAQTDLASAAESFNKAISLAAGDPLPRLGLGLTLIRGGDLDSGGRHLEIAVNLNPNRAIYRSYLGKTYYEQRRDTNVVDQEFLTAKEMDDKDPTPYLYSAIQKQTTNRPVKALRDAEKAIELNNNRAVYRSKLALDEDLAARSAATARIYSDLGFQQLALVEGWKSVNTDPGNHSAHRLLADSYSALPRHEIARVSELLQSQLLQPNNMTPIQPRLSESNLFLISSGGPGGLSFNEFNPLFNRDGLTFQGSGLYGSNDTHGGEAIVSGIFDRASFSLGFSNFETEGWRENADQIDDVATAFFQFEISPETSVQAEYRYRNLMIGDQQLRFFQDDFKANLNKQVEKHFIRAGFRHEFSEISKVLGNFSYQESKRDISDDPSSILHTEIDGKDTSYAGEIQHLLSFEKYRFVSGVGYFKVDSAEDILSRVTITPPFLPSFQVSSRSNSDKDVEHFNAYLYSSFDVFENVTLTLGLSADFFESDQRGSASRDQLNPKLGFVWNPLPDTTIRAAAFRTLKRTLAYDQTLEPTQVAGFNQFYDDFNATDAWRYGVAIDQKFGKQVFIGAEYSYRDLDVPFIDSGLTTQQSSWQEDIARAYFYWTPFEFLAVSARHEWEKFNRDSVFSDGAEYLQTHRIPLALNVFDRTGLSLSLQAMYVDQQGRFERSSSLGTFVEGADHFWTIDASVNYRLPRRYGFISLGASNITNEKFNYFDIDRDNPAIQPSQFLYSRITLSF